MEFDPSHTLGQAGPLEAVRATVNLSPISSSRPALLPSLGSQVPELTPIVDPVAVGSRAGRLRFFAVNWAKISEDRWILECVRGYKIPLLKVPLQPVSLILSSPTPPPPLPTLLAWPTRYPVSSSREW